MGTRAVCDGGPGQCVMLYGDRSYLDPSCVGLETSGRVLCGHSALDSTAVHSDLVLLEVQLWKTAALAYVQLGMHQVHTVRQKEREK